MSFRLTLTVVTCLSLTACATVDLNEVAYRGSDQQASAVELNVVQRAANKLYAVFSSRGFVAKTSRKRMHSAAQVLLKGLEAKEVTQNETGYVALAMDKTVVLSDIRLATGHVEQTTKAAEVYLAMVSGDRSVREELSSLEQALLASRDAERVFEEALSKTGAQTSASDFVNFVAAVDALRDITNAFGNKVREDQSDVPEAVL